MVQRQSLMVLKDPNSEGSMEDIQLQSNLLSDIKIDVEDISVTVNQAEKIRRQLLDLQPMLPSSAEDIHKQLTLVDSAILEIENEMIQLKQTGTGQDNIRTPGKLLEKLSYLSSAVAVADFPAGRSTCGRLRRKS